jgi:hypothetical protein
MKKRKTSKWRAWAARSLRATTRPIDFALIATLTIIRDVIREKLLFLQRATPEGCLHALSLCIYSGGPPSINESIIYLHSISIPLFYSNTIVYYKQGSYNSDVHDLHMTTV